MKNPYRVWDWSPKEKKQIEDQLFEHLPTVNNSEKQEFNEHLQKLNYCHKSNLDNQVTNLVTS